LRISRRAVDLVFLMYNGLVGVLFGILMLVLASTAVADTRWAQQLFDALGSTFIVGSLFGILYTNISRNIYYEELRYLGLHPYD